jgi:hypothetical protein
MAVGIALHLLLMVAGTAFGLALTDDASPLIRLSDLVWNVASMLVGAFFGGYVAARVSGMRRTADGLLHGAVAWGATTVVFAALTVTSLGPLVDELFGTIAGYGRTAGPRTRTTYTPPRTFVGKAVRSPDPATLTVDSHRGTTAARLTQLQIEEGGASAAVPDAGSGSSPGEVSGWLSGAMLASLLVGLVGGAVGANGVRRFTQQSSHVAPGVGDVRGRRRVAGAS